MKAQTPAQGISLQSDWGSSKTYRIECECTDDHHSHIFDVEADRDFGVTATIWTTAHVPIWNVSRWKLIWKLLTKGEINYQVSLILREQQALNYAKAIELAIKDVKEFKK